jgi:hypothetical protein
MKVRTFGHAPKGQLTKNPVVLIESRGGRHSGRKLQTSRNQDRSMNRNKGPPFIPKALVNGAVLPLQLSRSSSQPSTQSSELASEVHNITTITSRDRNTAHRKLELSPGLVVMLRPACDRSLRNFRTGRESHPIGQTRWRRLKLEADNTEETNPQGSC